MIKNIILITIIAFYSSSTSAQNIARVENVKIESKNLNQEREILIYTPVDYDWRENESFNVIYVFDSQSREFFDYTSSMISFLTDNTKSYIVVGITSPYNEKLDYARNNDLLPVLETENSKSRYGKYSGNADNFFAFVSDEIIPFIDSNYRTLNNRIAVGHSLSASFVLNSFIKNPNLFNSYIAISPNLAYDKDKLANELVNFDYSKIEKPTYLYLSSANEGIDYWKEWKPAREKVYSFYKQKLQNNNLKVQINEFPECNHWGTFPPSLNKGLDFYFKQILDLQEKELSKEEYEATIKVKVLKKEDTIYITGNQDNLGNWNPEKIKMEKISDFERQITLKLKSPAQFKLTRGNWKSEAEVIGTYGNITIRPEKQTEFEFEIEYYLDN
ncbi:alpha/beta hydrolase-fold protein [Gelidibacter sp. F63206]|uniref:alpha/beta hydrolase-fold protein n=1 Tax=Gelidibacter sp. F63206 TaxID=2926425 RepID=UPI001FF6859D|nr:alpha/beta hydrolase-fold protein [Gelidibacter sp. F63206]MCK0114414.1 alpha/beta hydrolase-fold protein [Gelidibacter sp. F63206]